MTTRIILLIHAEPRLREIVHECLSDIGGWQVFSTGSSSDWLQYAIEYQLDAIVLDLSSSGIDYVTFLQRLRAQPETQTTPVVVLTSGARWLNLNRFQPFQVAGAIDYSSDPSMLPQQITQLLDWQEES